MPHMYWPMDENCQYLNVWTPSIDSKGEAAGHGGGCTEAASLPVHLLNSWPTKALPMSKYGDVVVVSLNHRLNVLGYLDLSLLGKNMKALPTQEIWI